MSTFAFVFDLCRPVVDKANVTYNTIFCYHGSHLLIMTETHTHTLRFIDVTHYK